MSKQDITGRWPSSKKEIAAQYILLVGHAITVITGLIWVVQPSASVERQLNIGWSLAWSLIFVISGAIAFVARWLKKWSAEAFALFMTAGGLLIWGLLVINTTVEVGTLTALQTGIRFVGGAVILVGFALLELGWVSLRKGLGEMALATLIQQINGKLSERNET